MVDYNEAFDEINEQRKYSRAGFTKGYAMGEEAGWREGFLFGLKKGASLATEIGFYQGYTTAWLTLLEKQDQGKARKVQALRSLLEMARTFPLEEQLLSSVASSPLRAAADPLLAGGNFAPRLSKIRAKFRQVQGLLLDQRGMPSPSPSTTSAHHYQQQQQQSHQSSTPHVPPAGTAHPAARHAAPSSTSSSHHLHPPPPAGPAFPTAAHYHNWIHRSRSPSGFAGSFESRTSSQTDGPTGTAPTEMSF